MGDSTIQDIPVGWLGVNRVNTLLTTAARLHGSPETLDTNDLQAMLQNSTYAELATTICADSTAPDTCRTNVAQFSAALRRWLPEHNAAQFAALRRDFDQRLVGLQRAARDINSRSHHRTGDVRAFWQRFVRTTEQLTGFDTAHVTTQLANTLFDPAYQAWNQDVVALLRRLPPPHDSILRQIALSVADHSALAYALTHLLRQDAAATLVPQLLDAPDMSAEQKKRLAHIIASQITRAATAANLPVLLSLLPRTDLSAQIRDGIAGWGEKEWSTLFTQTTTANHPQDTIRLAAFIPWHLPAQSIAFWHQHLDGAAKEIRAAALDALLMWGTTDTNTLLLLHDLEAHEPEPALRTSASAELKRRSIVHYEYLYRGSRCRPY